MRWQTSGGLPPSVKSLSSSPRGRSDDCRRGAARPAGLLTGQRSGSKLVLEPVTVAFGRTADECR
jgi:hypothetical protein